MDVFQESPPMSTYILAFVISNFGYEDSVKTNNNITFRIWAHNNSLDQTRYAKEIGPQMLEYFETYLDVTYPLPKQDMIALPGKKGAMENWGLITYSELYLLYKEGVSALENKQLISLIVSHELAHNWFGNLVTPSWWTNLWLNEGFASYFMYLGADHVHPEFKHMEQFVIDKVQHVFSIDVKEKSHPISIDAEHQLDIWERLGAQLYYLKGASIIRMMHHFLTDETFKKALSNYLREL